MRGPRSPECHSPVSCAVADQDEACQDRPVLSPPRVAPVVGLQEVRRWIRREAASAFLRTSCVSCAMRRARVASSCRCAAPVTSRAPRRHIRRKSEPVLPMMRPDGRRSTWLEE